MISLSPALIKPLIGIAALAAIVLYAKHVINERDHFEKKYNEELSLHQEAANALLSERLNYREAQKDAEALEVKFNEITQQNTKYRNCIANGTCSVSLRNQAQTNNGKTDTGTVPQNNDSTGGIKFTVQQDIFDLRASIQADEVKIVGLQAYINKYCYKPVTE